MDSAIHIVNLIALQQLPQAELQAHYGQYALIHQGHVIEYFDTNREALKAGSSYHPGQYSIQLVHDQPSDLGFVDCADG